MNTTPRTRWLALLLLLVAAVPVACLVGADAPDDEASTLEAVGLRPVVEPLVGHAGVLAPAALRGARSGDGAAEAADPDAEIGLTWVFEPAELMVFRSTAVHFRLEQAPSDHETASCSWNFGDGSPSEEGCTVSHTFHGGQADQVVTLTLRDGDWTWSSTRSIPLERLPVVDGLLDEAVEGPSATLPAAPELGTTSFRFAVIADTAARGGVPADVRDAMKQLAREVRPDLVVHAGGATVAGEPPEAWKQAREALQAPLRDADIPLAFALSPTDRAEGARTARPGLQMLDDRHYPERYTFTFKGAFFLVFSSSDSEGVDEDTLAWMRDELAKARVYEARYVVSYLPLHKLTDEHLGSLDKKFRLYELFLRARVTTAFSAGYRVFYKGRYGALPIVSVGTLAGTGGRLAGTDFAQPPSFVVVDQERGVPERVFGVVGPTYDRVFDEGLLPETVEVYTR